MKTDKKQGRHVVLKFVLILIGSFLLGLGSAILLNLITDGEYIDAKALAEVVAPVVPVLFVGLHVVLCAASFLLIHSAKKQMALWDGESEERANQIEARLSWALILANTMTILNFFFFSAMIQVTEFTAFGQAHDILMFPICLGVFVLGYVWIILATNLAVKLEKQLNPEKQGNVFDTKFNKVWLGSCDELEKQQIYKCGYTGYKVGNTACMVLWIISIFGQLWAKTGLLPVVMVCAIWLSMNLGYLLSARKM